MKKFIIITILFFSLSLALSAQAGVPAMAQVRQTVDYNGQPALDSDLDGLTDKGEIELYHTDPNNPDTDGDGMLDGAEVINGTDPLDAKSFAKLVQDSNIAIYTQGTPWTWYLVRASGLVAFFLLYLNIFFGLAIRMPGLSKLVKPIYSLEMHHDFAIQSILFVIPHITLLLFDKTMKFKIEEILVPFVSQYKPEWVGFGIVAFYLMLVLILTSYFRRHFSRKIWRAAHFLNVILYLTIVVHSLFLGTDLKGRIPANIFLIANGLLFFMFVTGLSVMVFRHFKKPASQAQ